MWCLYLHVCSVVTRQKPQNNPCVPCLVSVAWLLAAWVRMLLASSVFWNVGLICIAHATWQHILQCNGPMQASGGQYPNPIQKLLHECAACGRFWSDALSLLSQSRCGAAVPAAPHTCSLSFPADSSLPEAGAGSELLGANKAVVLAAPRV